MEKDDIHVGQECAFLKNPEYSKPLEPMRAVVLDEPVGGKVRVIIHHPDVGQYEDTVRTRELVGLWGEEPEVDRFLAYGVRLTKAHAQGRLFTWADAAELRYEQVRRQRALATRLGGLGIVRAPRHYAGQGGGSENAKDSLLQLNLDELERLLDRVERGPGAVYLPPSAELEEAS